MCIIFIYTEIKEQGKAYTSIVFFCGETTVPLIKHSSQSYLQ